MTQPPIQNKSSNKKLLGAIAIIIILASALSSFAFFSAANNNDVEPKTLKVQVDPAGSSFQLGVGTEKTFTATALNGTAPFNYTWTLAPTGYFNLSINGEIISLKNTISIEVSGQNLTLSYPVAVENDFVQAYVTITDANGANGKSDSIIVADPYTSPGYKFDASTATAAIICQADGTGWYRAINGTNGAVISSLSSTDPDATLDGALSLANGKTIYVTGGSWSGAVLAVPAATTLLADPSTTGIKYSSIGSGARIDEPTFNLCFGGYISGNYTIVTGYSAVSSGKTWYLAFKPDGSIPWSSTNASYLINHVSVAGKGTISFGIGNFTIDTPLFYQEYVTLCGSIVGSTYHVNQSSGTVLYYTGDGAMFRDGNPNAIEFYPSFVNLVLQANQYSRDTACFDFPEVRNPVLENIFIYDFGVGINMNGSYAFDGRAIIPTYEEMTGRFVNINIIGCYDGIRLYGVDMANNYFEQIMIYAKESPSRYGIICDGNTSYSALNNGMSNFYQTRIIANFEKAIYVTAGSCGNEFYGMDIETNSTYYAIYVEDSITPVYGYLIYGNVFSGVTVDGKLELGNYSVTNLIRTGADKKTYIFSTGALKNETIWAPVTSTSNATGVFSVVNSGSFPSSLIIDDADTFGYASAQIPSNTKSVTAIKAVFIATGTVANMQAIFTCDWTQQGASIYTNHEQTMYTRSDTIESPNLYTWDITLSFTDSPLTANDFVGIRMSYINNTNARFLGFYIEYQV